MSEIVRKQKSALNVRVRLCADPDAPNSEGPASQPIEWDVVAVPLLEWPEPLPSLRRSGRPLPWPRLIAAGGVSEEV